MFMVCQLGLTTSQTLLFGDHLSDINQPDLRGIFLYYCYILLQEILMGVFPWTNHTGPISSREDHGVTRPPLGSRKCLVEEGRTGRGLHQKTLKLQNLHCPRFMPTFTTRCGHQTKLLGTSSFPHLISSHLIWGRLCASLGRIWLSRAHWRNLAADVEQWAVTSFTPKRLDGISFGKPGSVLDLIYSARPFKGNQCWRDRIGHGGHYLGIQTSGCSNHGSPGLVTFTFLDVHSRRRKWLITSTTTLIPIWSIMIIDIVSEFIINGLESPIFNGKIYGFL